MPIIPYVILVISPQIAIKTLYLHLNRNNKDSTNSTTAKVLQEYRNV